MPIIRSPLNFGQTMLVSRKIVLTLATSAIREQAEAISAAALIVPNPVHADLVTGVFYFTFIDF